MAERVYRIPAPVDSFASWPAWQRAAHLTHCCQFCRDPQKYIGSYHGRHLGRCAGCGQLGCPNCIRGCADCFWDFPPPLRLRPRHPRVRVPLPAVLAPVLLPPWTFTRKCIAAGWSAPGTSNGTTTPRPCAHTLKAASCILHQRKVRDTLVREVERNLLLGAKDRAAPARDAPTATVVLHRLVRTGQEQMASVVLDFAGGRRHGGPRRNIKPRPKLRAKKDTRRKAPRKTLAKSTVL